MVGLGEEAAPPARRKGAWRMMKGEKRDDGAVREEVNPALFQGLRPGKLWARPRRSTEFCLGKQDIVVHLVIYSALFFAIYWMTFYPVVFALFSLQSCAFSKL